MLYDPFSYTDLNFLLNNRIKYTLPTTACKR